MENFLPDWNFENEFHISNQKGSIGPENELSELLWKDGQVILQSQTRRKPILNNSNNQTQIRKQSQQCFKSDKINRDSRSNFLEDEETVSWIQYPLDDDDNPFEKDFSSGFFSGFPSFDSVELSDLTELSKTEQEQRIGSNNMAPPRLKQCQESKAVGLDNRRESSFLAVGLSHCGSKKSTNDADLRITTTNSSIGLYDGVLDPKSASCSGGTSGSGVSGDFKRKCTETEESETRSKSIQRSGSSRRRRVAEVHNLSERRRRDRINDKMKALQELIPHCGKTDKASVLDEAIDYLKSLQLQLQVMWMGSGMAPPMLFPGVQPCITRISMLDQSATRNPGLVCQNQVFNPVNPYQNPMPNPALPEQFARYIEGFHQMQATSQPMNMFKFGSQTAQQSQTAAETSKGGNGPNTERYAINNLPTGS